MEVGMTMQVRLWADIPKSLVSVLCFVILFSSPAYSVTYDGLRAEVAADGDITMVDGPFYVGGDAYYTLDFMMMGESRETRVYDTKMKEVKGRTARKVLAVRDMKYILIAEPLFYAPGDPKLLIAAGEYDIHNARNVASLAELTPEEREKLERYFDDYHRVMEDVAEVNRLTNEILYPHDSLEIGDDWSTFAYDLGIETTESGYYSYEGLKDLVAAYEKTVEDYDKMVSDLDKFAALEEFDLPEVRRRLSGRLEDLEGNGRAMGERVAIRRELLDGLGRPSLCGPSFILLFPMLMVFSRRPTRGFALLLLLASISAVVWAAQDAIPAPEELALRTVNVEQVPISLAVAPGSGMDISTVRGILRDYYTFPFLLEGEAVTVRGPYYHYGTPYYLLEITMNGLPTGLALIDSETHTLVRHQKTAFQLVKAVRASETLKRDPVYTSESADEVYQYLKKKASGLKGGPLKKFLTDEITNLEEGKVLEQELMVRPDFETLVKYNENLLKGYIILSNIQRVTSKEEAETITRGFTVNMPRIETLVIVSSGPTAEEFYLGKRSRYIRRSLIRVATLESLAEAGERPSKGYLLSSYIITDMIYSNPLLYPEATGKSRFVEEYLKRWRNEG
jgi:hypothetical protein